MSTKARKKRQSEQKDGTKLFLFFMLLLFSFIIIKILNNI